MNPLILGTIAFDTIRTPNHDRSLVLGGTASFSATAASIFSSVDIMSIVGQDFTDDHWSFFHHRCINTQGVTVGNGPTFFWEGRYEGNMSQAISVDTQLNVLTQLNPALSPSQQAAQYVLLANTDPDIQMHVLDQLIHPKLVMLDTMNFWINTKISALTSLIPRVHVLVVNDQEMSMLTGHTNMIAGIQSILATGIQRVIVKKGEHGAIMGDHRGYFAIPSVPLTNVVDPTGAGDSFAGGMLGYLSMTDDLSDTSFRQSMVIGNIIAAHTTQGFGVNHLAKLNRIDINKTFKTLSSMVAFPETTDRPV